MADWRAFCRSAGDVVVDGDAVDVTFANERRHRVGILETDDGYELAGVVARASVVGGLPDAPLRAWRRNRTSQLVGFRIDRKGRLVGEAWVPKDGLRGDEFLLYARRVAAECDLFEHQLTGRDQE